MNNLNNTINSLNSQISSLNQQIAALNKEINDLNAQIIEATKQRDAILAIVSEWRSKNATQTAEIRALESQIAVLDAKIAELKKILAEKEAEIVGLKGELAKKDAEIVKLNAVIEEKNKVISNLESVLSTREQQIIALQTDISNLQLSLRLKTTELIAITESSKTTREQLEAEIKEYVQQISDKQDQIQILNEELTRIRLELKTVQDQNQLYLEKIQTLVAEQTHLKSLYDKLVVDYENAKLSIINLRSISSQTLASYELIKNKLVTRINNLTNQYNIASTDAVKLKEQLRQLKTVCPSLQHGSVVLDLSAPTTKYYVDNGVLRTISEDEYRSIGRPEIKTYPTLQNCSKAGAMQSFVDTEINVLVDGKTWDEDGRIRAVRLNMTNTSLELSEFARDPSVAWIIDDSGKIRSLHGSGMYLSDNACSVPVASDRASSWKLEQSDHPRKFKLRSSECGKYMNTTSGSIALSNATSNGFYIVPIGRVKIPS